MTQTPKKKKSRGNLLLRLFLSILAAYAIVTLVDMQVTLGQKVQELEELQVQVEAQRLSNKELERELDAGMDGDFVERYARDHLDYVAPNERVFIDISGS